MVEKVAPVSIKKSFPILYVKFSGELWGATEDQLTMSFEGELCHRRRTTNLLGVLESMEIVP